MVYDWLIIAAVIFGLFLVIFKSQDAMFFVTLFKKNLFYIVLIAAIAFVAFSLYNIQANNDVDLGSYDGAVQASNVYLGWLKSVGSNLVKVTGYAIEQDWWVNGTAKDGS
jgi:hypothetical protein